MKIFYSLVFTSLLISNFCLGQEWTEVRLSNSYSIQFPSPPEITESSEEIHYLASDDMGMYVATIWYLKDKNIPTNELPQFYDGYFTGTINAVEGDLVKMDDFQTNEIKGKEIIYLTYANLDLPDLRHQRVFIAENNVVSYEFWDIEHLAAASKEKFFDSISSSVEKNPAAVQKADNPAYKLGYVVGRIIPFLFVAGLILAAIFLFWLLMKKRKKAKSSTETL